MEQDLISKKDLLDLTGISYGQLYRWKRKSLIPEAWFIRKSTFTGQETFFPREQMLARLDKIMNMKEDLSLDELADVLSPSPVLGKMEVLELKKRNIVSETSCALASELWKAEPELSFDRILQLYLLDQLLTAGDISLDEGRALLKMMDAHYPQFEGRPCELFLLRKMGVSVFLLVSADSELQVEAGARVVARRKLTEAIEALKLALSK